MIKYMSQKKLCCCLFHKPHLVQHWPVFSMWPSREHFRALFSLQQQLRKEVTDSHCCQDLMKTQQGMAGEINFFLCVLSDINVCSSLPTIWRVICTWTLFLVPLFFHVKTQREITSCWTRTGKVCSAAVFASQDPGSKVVEMISKGYVNKTEFLKFIYSWSSSGPIQQQITLDKFIWGSSMCVLKNVVLHLS